MDEQQQSRRPSAQGLYRGAKRAKRALSIARWLFSIDGIPLFAIGVLFFVFILVLGFGFAGGAGGVSAGEPNGGIGAEGNDTATQSAFPQPSFVPGTKPNEVFYCQWDSGWKNNSYNTSTIGHTGCSPTSMAMVLSSYGGTQRTPADIASIFTQMGWAWETGNVSCKNNDGTTRDCKGTKYWLPPNKDWLNSLGFERGPELAHRTSALDLQTVKNYTDAGWLLYAAVYWPEISGGHQIVIEGADPQAGTIRVRDPNSCPNGIKNRSLSGLFWYSVIPIRPRQ